jgi:2-polyprenyl-6-methoxyphenol hydroxylase-like FAD-dependent oxidoreductase
MDDLGLFDELLSLPHAKARVLSGTIGDTTLRLADFSRLPTRAKYIAFMPQWNFLDFLARKAALYPGFRLLMRSEALSLVSDGGIIQGVIAETPQGPLEIRAGLTIGADGRHSTVREAAGFVPQEIGAPMDVLWFRLSRRPDDPHQAFGRAEAGRILILIDRGEHWQCGYVIAKGAFARMQAEDIASLRRSVAELVPFARDRVDEIASWDDVKLLTVSVNRLPVWHRPGLLCIGDAAHAMSPVGGVGINLAIQDAVAAANLLAAPLRTGGLTETELAAVQRRREFPARVTQRMQLAVQDRVISRVLGREQALRPPMFLRLLARFPRLRRLPARLIGLGIRPAHVRSPRA